MSCVDITRSYLYYVIGLTIYSRSYFLHVESTGFVRCFRNYFELDKSFVILLMMEFVAAYSHPHLYAGG